MNGRISFILVLLIVLAIPLFAAHDLVKPVVEFSAISTNNEEVPFNQQELFDSNIAILAVGLQKPYTINTIDERLYANADIGNGLKKYKTKNIYGGVSRINSGRH